MSRKQSMSVKLSLTTKNTTSNQEEFDNFLKDETFFKKSKPLNVEQPQPLQTTTETIDNSRRADIIGSTGLVRKAGMNDNTIVASSNCTTHSHLESCIAGSVEPRHPDPNTGNRMHKIITQPPLCLIPETTFSSDKW